MTERILSTLSALGIGVYTINAVTTASAELFSLRKGKEDMRRFKRIQNFAVTVYRDFDEYRGSSGVLLSPGMSDDELTEKLKSAYENAQYVKNPFFELPEPTVQPVAEKPEAELWQAAESMRAALDAADVNADSFVNSAEIFAESTYTRILTSRGTDVSYSVLNCKGEFVVQCREPMDVEMYQAFDYLSADTESLTKLASEALATVRDRAHAVTAPAAGQYDIILAGEQLAELMSMYPEKADVSMVFAHYSQYKAGMQVQGEDVKGEKLNIKLYSQAPYSDDGIPMPERELIKDGELKQLHGATRFCRYLGIEPVGSYKCMKVDNGTMPLAEMRKGKVLMPVAFSDFQMDALRGSFAGEIRLAYLYEDGKVTLLTGGSVNGSLTEKQSDLRFSLERFSNASYSGPYAVLIPSVNVSGK